VDAPSTHHYFRRPDAEGEQGSMLKKKKADDAMSWLRNNDPNVDDVTPDCSGARNLAGV
jgi:hypothetical protein